MARELAFAVFLRQTSQKTSSAKRSTVGKVRKRKWFQKTSEVAGGLCIGGSREMASKDPLCTRFFPELYISCSFLMYIQ